MNIIEMAREAGLYVGTNLSGVMLVGHAKHNGLLIHLDIDDLTRFAALVRAAALDEADKVIEAIADEYGDEEVSATWIAAAIRQLKTGEQT